MVRGRGRSPFRSYCQIWVFCRSLYPERPGNSFLAHPAVFSNPSKIVSGGFGADENAWTDAIEDTLALIRSRFPSTRSIVLIPVVGGPNHQDCPIDGGRVRASWQHAHIDNAIQMVVAGDGVGNLVAGFSPEVRTCDDYRDRLGHLTDSGAEAAGRAIGNFYRGS